MNVEQLRTLALDVPTCGPWLHRRGYDGALILEDVTDGEPVVLVYGGLGLALYLEALAPATLLGMGRP